jgi:Flp pilus assembly pilin Flp
MTDEHGGTATEYGIVTAFIVFTGLAGASLFGLAVGGWYDDLAAHLKFLLGIP